VACDKNGKLRKRTNEQAIVIVLWSAMIAVIITTDFVLFRNRFWEGLMVDVGSFWYLLLST
jgi:hypothetical protein